MATAPDTPLAMNDWEIAVSEDRTVYYNNCYHQKRFLNKDEARKSGESSCSGRTKRKKRLKSSSSEESALTVQKERSKTGDSPCREKSEFAAIHHERALNAGKLNKTDRGRRWRKKCFNKVCREDKSCK